MIPLQKAVFSSVGKKLLMAITGLGMVGFTISHLAANVMLYLPEGTLFNQYADTLASYGPLLWAAEIALLGALIVHVIVAVTIKKDNTSARPVAYKSLRSKGGKSLSNVSSRNMIISGIVLLAFLIMHIWQFKFGPSIEMGYITQINGKDARDLHRLVVETFASPVFVAIYVGAMLFLGMHLRHGFWSAFQSLGALNARFTKPVYVLGVAIAVLLAVGFLFIPIWLYFHQNGAAS